MVIGIRWKVGHDVALLEIRVCLRNLEESTSSAMFHGSEVTIQTDFILFHGDVANLGDDADCVSLVNVEKCYPSSKLWWV